jgi:hypothetical protein
VHYVTVEQGPDQSPEVCVTACANKGKPRIIINPCLILNDATIFVILCAVTFRN